MQNEAVKAAEKSVVLTMDQYKAGTVSYLNVVTAQTIALTNETTAVQILGQRMTAAVLLVQALGGGWNIIRPTIEPVSNKRLGLKSICIAPTLE